MKQFFFTTCFLYSQKVAVFSQRTYFKCKHVLFKTVPSDYNCIFLSIKFLNLYLYSNVNNIDEKTRTQVKVFIFWELDVFCWVRLK